WEHVVMTKAAILCGLFGNKCFALRCGELPQGMCARWPTAIVALHQQHIFCRFDNLLVLQFFCRTARSRLAPDAQRLLEAVGDYRTIDRLMGLAGNQPQNSTQRDKQKDSGGG